MDTNEATPTATAVATITTSKGDIVLDLYGNEAPNTVANFISKAKSGFYNNLTFHRVEDWVIQGGDPKGDGTGGGTMKTELNSLPFVTGSLGVARGGDINVSNDSQFFIVKSESSWLNNQYTNFGTVSAGMDVVGKIAIGDKIISIEIK
ncbi:MAG TPA: peptidylprolyl isomerase [Candidatus Saccharimonadales bacterium]|nr:peptidylprolyl isomerase [Candidatus Saccharimonadales bacterium]